MIQSLSDKMEKVVKTKLIVLEYNQTKSVILQLRNEG